MKINTNKGFNIKTEYLNPCIKAVEDPAKKKQQEFAKFLLDLYYPDINKSRFLI